MALHEKKVQDFRLIGNRRINKEYFILELESETLLPEIKPGQFAQLRIDNAPDVFLRRPISFYNVDNTKKSIQLLIQEVGKGTRKLAETEPGEIINLIYPLGNSFSLPENRKVIIIGGGVGVAPLLFLGKYLKENNIEPEFLLGFRNKDLLTDLSDFELYGRVFLTTDDGSAGEKGTVLDHSILNNGLKGYSRIYTCGPEIMMKAVGEFAGKNGIDCEVSLENTMACGFGACLCCVQNTVHGNLRVCMEGPVFNTQEIKW